MVGDLRIDLEAARAANAICIIVKRSHGDGLNLNPDYYVNSLGEIPAVLDKSLGER
jgi:phosphoglycolate phosphatase-like HAD superfamily hydrolase